MNVHHHRKLPLAAAAVFAGCSLGAASADIIVFTTTMSGPNESPPVVSAGIGTSTVTYDTVARTMRVQADWSGLTGTTTVSHIHGPTLVPFAGTAGVMTPTPTFTGFPTGITAGSYDMTFDMSLASSYNPAFVTANGGSVPAAQESLFRALAEGKAYLNIHSTFAGSGEIRGFYVPAPSAAPLLALAGSVALHRRRGRGM